MLNNVPLDDQNLQQTQSPILNNFITIDSVFEVDHQSYGTTDQGKHNKITLPAQSPAPTFASTEIGIYNFLDPITSKRELFIKLPNLTTFAMTSYDFQATGPFSGGIGWQYLPTKFKQIWGTTSITSGGTITITFASNPGGGISTFPGFTGDGSGNFVGYFNLVRMNASTPTTNYPVLSAITLTTMTVTSSDGNNLTFMWNVTGF